MAWSVAQLQLSGSPVALTNVTGIASLATGEIAALVRYPAAVVLFAPNGKYVRHFDCVGCDQPHGITTADDGRILVVDEVSCSVRVFSRDGTLVETLGNPGVPSDSGVDWSQPRYADKYRSIRRGAPPFNRPTNCALSAWGSLYVSDGYGNSRVHQFDQSGVLIRSWGEPGSGPSQFRNPHDLTTTTDGRVLVADRENDRVQAFDPEGKWIGDFARVQRPTAVAQLPDGQICVASMRWRVGDFDFARGPVEQEQEPYFTVFDAQGQPIERVGGSTLHPDESVQPLSAPHGLGVLRDGSVLAAEMTAAYASQIGAELADDFVAVSVLRPE
jgi:DNA-binding beta-propeller fold protein YncE